MTDTRSGDLREHVAFEKRSDLSDQSPAGDGYGNVEGDFAEVFRCRARMVPRLGGEEVMAARLSGRQPYTLTVRQSSDSRQVTTEWRVRNLRTNTLYNIRAVADPNEKSRYLDMLVEAGVAV